MWFLEILIHIPCQEISHILAQPKNELHIFLLKVGMGNKHTWNKIIRVAWFKIDCCEYEVSIGAWVRVTSYLVLEPQYLISHTDPVCKFFSKNYLMAKLLQNNSNLNDLEYSRHLKVRKIEKKAKKNFEGQTKARGQKTQIFIIFWTF